MRRWRRPRTVKGDLRDERIMATLQYGEVRERHNESEVKTDNERKARCGDCKSQRDTAKWQGLLLQEMNVLGSRVGGTEGSATEPRHSMSNRSLENEPDHHIGGRCEVIQT